MAKKRIKTPSKSAFARTSKADGKRTAKKPGLRKSASGNTYVETRTNRSDINPSKKAARSGRSK